METIELTCCKCERKYLYNRAKRNGASRKTCASCSVAKRRKKVKQILIEELGGKCIICGYNKYIGALEFHHLDPNKKKFHLSNGDTRSLDKAREEASKCVLLCANCHREVEAGITILA